ncbi:LysR substrate-binding domain-containing protein [Dongia sp.]|uniref:LysR substrate-binding domain-containing protein n=1 Tax=Dongia sp. TaxID=1977262 RepID=UPI0035AE3169
MPKRTNHPQPPKKSARLRKTEPEAPPSRALPPLNALRAFDAAVRRGGFAPAAAELGVSPGAVSRQVRILEAAMGAALFERLAHGVELTEAGRRLAATAARAFGLLARAMVEEDGRRLRFHVSASFYLRWLLPRYADLRAALPRAAFDLAIVSTAISREEADLAILFHRGDEAGTGETREDGCHSERLFADSSILVCAPSLLGRRKVPLPVGELARLPLVLGTPDAWDWQRFAGLQGLHRELGRKPLSRGPRFDIDDAAIQAAMAGAGVALVERRFVSDLLAAGRLLQPFDLPPVSLGEYRLHWREPLGRRAPLANLRRWLKMAIAAGS